jgi:hypothetical protein
MSYFDRRGFLKGALLAGAVATVRPSSALDKIRGSLEKSGPSLNPTFRRIHAPIGRLSSSELSNLAGLIQTYAMTETNDSKHPTIASQHYLANGSHGGFMDAVYLGFAVPLQPLGRGRAFFTWHRDYIHGLERFLSQNGFSKGLPSWAPWEPIPPEFSVNIAPRSTPIVKEGDFTPWSHERIGCWKSDDQMGFYLSWGPHFKTHFNCGGEMAIIETAPNAPIFWPWHTFVDDLYSDWEQHPACSVWSPQPLTGTRGTVSTPWCMGEPFNVAKGLIEGLRLQVGDRSGFGNDMAPVISQQPLPGVRLAMGASVNLSGEVPKPFGSTRYPLF